MSKIVKVNFWYGLRYLRLLEMHEQSQWAQLLDPIPSVAGRRGYGLGDMILLSPEVVMHPVAEDDIPDEVLRYIAKQELLRD